MLTDILFFDIETTGLPPKGAEWDKDFNQFPLLCEIAWCLNEKEKRFIIKPDGWIITPELTAIHGISHEQAIAEGTPFDEVITEFIKDCHRSQFVVAHNIYFDVSITKAMILRIMGKEWFVQMNVEDALFKGKRIDTMMKTIKFVGACYPDGRRGKFPKLEELHEKLFGEGFAAHSALEDVRALARCLPELVKQGVIDLKIKEYPAEVKEIQFDKPKESEHVATVKVKTIGAEPLPVVEVKVDPEIKGLLDINDDNF